MILKFTNTSKNSTIKNLLLVALLFVSTMSFAQPGSTDPTFNTFDGGVLGYGSVFNSSIHKTALQPDGKIIVAGAFHSYGYPNGKYYVARLNNDGTRDTSFNGGLGFNNAVTTIFIQSDGKIILEGLFTSFNGENGINKIVRLNANGTRDNSFHAGMEFNDYIYSTAIQPDGKIIVGGDFTSFNGINGIVRLNTNGTRDTTFNTSIGFANPISFQADGKLIVGVPSGFNVVTNGMNYIIVRLHYNGVVDTTFNVGSGFNNYINSISIQANGKMIVGGSFSSFNGTTGINGIIRLNTNGTRDTTFNAGVGLYSGVRTTAIQADGKIIVGGYFSSFNGTTGIKKIVRLNANGNIDTTFKTDTGLDFLHGANSIFIQADGKIILEGGFTSLNHSAIDYRLVRLLNGCIPTSSSQNVTACNSYTWLANGNNYTNSGTYTTKLTNAAGCDSTINLNLTIKKPTTDTQNISICNSYQWLANGTTYNNSGTYTTKLTSAAGCDSTITLNLTIKKPTTNSQNVAVCNSYTWLANGNTYTNSGTYTTKLTNAVGCDSTITLNLTIKKPTTNSQNVAVCNSYTWLANGNTYTNSGTYTTKLTNAVGCDSTITLNLTIKPKPVLTTSVSSATITANETGATYQWIDCNKEKAPIAGAVSQSFTATANGSYAVIVTKNTCSGTSACVNINTIGISPIVSQNAQVIIYPNPNNGAFTISAESEGVYTIQNSLGQIIQSVILNAANNYTINIENLSNGVYFVAGYNNNRITQQKVVVSK